MFDCSYSREPVDYRLLVLRILKKAWRIPVFALGGAVLVFAVYFFVKTVVMGRTYLVENKYYIDFAEDTAGNQYEWVNQYTWCELADMDVFINPVYEELGGSVTTDELRAYSDCTIESDGRYLYLRIITPSPELSEKIAASYEKALYAFGDAHKEFASITMEHKGEAKENTNIRVVQMLIIGAVAGLLVLIVVMLTLDIVDTSIYIPATMEKRYHFPTVTAPCMSEYAINCKAVIGARKSVAVVNMDENPVAVEIPIESCSVVQFGNPIIAPVLFDEISKFEAVIINVKAANHNGKQLERLIEEFSRLEIKLDALVLSGEDRKLIEHYYRA